ncbi:MAG: ParA family protein [Bacteroidales bacterium]|nr:ParA family protein [Bacteroidales bacterium]
MCKVISISNHKGGVGKTQTALEVSYFLAAKGYKVLAVDIDQQANLTRAFLREPPAVTLYDSLMEEEKPLPVYKVKENLDLVPASPEMFGVGLKLILRQVNIPEDDCRMILRRKLKPYLNQYDYILINCPPSDNLMTINALYATVNVIVVANPEPFSVYGVKNFVDMMWQVKRDVNPALRLAGILINNYVVGSSGHINAEKALRDWAPKFVCTAMIRQSRPLYNSVLAHQHIFSYYPESNGAKDYNAFINEIIIKLK